MQCGNRVQRRQKLTNKKEREEADDESLIHVAELPTNRIRTDCLFPAHAQRERQVEISDSQGPHHGQVPAARIQIEYISV